MAPHTLPTAVNPPLTAETLETFLTRPLPPKEPLITGLVHRRDLITLGARRRHGKTTFMSQLAIAGATGGEAFLRHSIPRPFETLLVNLEDDARELQDKLRRQVGTRQVENRIRLVTRADFLQANIRIDNDNPQFWKQVRTMALSHEADLIIIDNLAHLVGGDYNDAKRTHRLYQALYALATVCNAAIVVPAHPRKKSLDDMDLADDPEGFFETIMGSSHFINSMGTLWGLQKFDDDNQTVFVGGRQRDDGTQEPYELSFDKDAEWFALSDNPSRNLRCLLTTETRRRAWSRLPEAPQTFSRMDGERLIQPDLKSSSTRQFFWTKAEQLGCLVQAGSDWRKASGASGA